MEGDAKTGDVVVVGSKATCTCPLVFVGAVKRQVDIVVDAVTKGVTVGSYGY